jgi:hypothetical protein
MDSLGGDQHQDVARSSLVVGVAPSADVGYMYGDATIGGGGQGGAQRALGRIPAESIIRFDPPLSHEVAAALLTPPTGDAPHLGE